MGDDSEWMKLPTEEKCNHKVKLHRFSFTDMIIAFSVFFDSGVYVSDYYSCPLLMLPITIKLYKCF